MGFMFLLKTTFVLHFKAYIYACDMLNFKTNTDGAELHMIHKTRNHLLFEFGIFVVLNSIGG